MSRYIDTDEIKRQWEIYGSLDVMDRILADVFPTADVVEVVRCKDCRHWNSETKGCKRNPSVEAWQEDDFCKYGKRWSNAID